MKRGNSSCELSRGASREKGISAILAGLGGFGRRTYNGRILAVYCTIGRISTISESFILLL
jgi:hypothetical protein